MKTRAILSLAALLATGAAVHAQGEATVWSSRRAMSLERDPVQADAKPWLADRGEGVHTSMFGNWIQKGEFLTYLFYEYTQNHDEEYKPEDLGFVGAQDFRARRVDHEALIWVAYGFTEDFMVEFESAVWTQSTQWKAKGDTSAMPRKVTERGLGDTEGQFRYRFIHETEDWPELLARFEYVLPLQKDRHLIGTQNWEFEVGITVTKGFSWGTLGLSIGYAYHHDEKKAELGEYMVEYVKKLSDSWRMVLALEGNQDELSGIIEFQWKPLKNVTIKLNTGIGITDKAPDWAPEVGIMISF